MKKMITTLEPKLTLAQKIAKSNAEFAALTPAKKRVAIAKDVIASIKTKKYEVTMQTYFELYTDKSIDTGKALQKSLLRKNSPHCEVCALGGLFASKCKIGNGDVDFRNYVDTTRVNDDGILESLKGIFLPRQLRLIEYCFEGLDIDNMFGDDNIDNPFGNDYYDDEGYLTTRSDIGKLCTRFYFSYSKPEGRMLAIMKNIIKHRGTFKPEVI